MEKENISGFIRNRLIPSRSSSRESDDDERYETADSGWSSDAVSEFNEKISLQYLYFLFNNLFQITGLFQEVPTASKTNKHSEAIGSDQLSQISDHPANHQESAEMDQRNHSNLLLPIL